MGRLQVVSSKLHKNRCALKGGEPAYRFEIRLTVHRKNQAQILTKLSGRMMLFELLPSEAGIATWRGLRKPCVRRWFSGPASYSALSHFLLSANGEPFNGQPGSLALSNPNTAASDPGTRRHRHCRSLNDWQLVNQECLLYSSSMGLYAQYLR